MPKEVKKIVIIDDQEEIAVVVKDVLESEGQFEARIATSGAKGLQLIEQDPPDLIVLDIMMPGMSGTDVAAKLSENPSHARIPILFATGLVAEDEFDMSSTQIGGREFLAKPFNTSQLFEKIEKLLN